MSATPPTVFLTFTCVLSWFENVYVLFNNIKFGLWCLFSIVNLVIFVCFDFMKFYRLKMCMYLFIHSKCSLTLFSIVNLFIFWVLDTSVWKFKRGFFCISHKYKNLMYRLITWVMILTFRYQYSRRFCIISIWEPIRCSQDYLHKFNF